MRIFFLLLVAIAVCTCLFVVWCFTATGLVQWTESTTPKCRPVQIVRHTFSGEPTITFTTPTIHPLTFGDGAYRTPAIKFGGEMDAHFVREKLPCGWGVRPCRVFSLTDIDEEFRDAHKEILSREKGAGLWLWKPYFCKRVWDAMADGDVLMYADGGLHIQPSYALVSYAERATSSQSGGLVFDQWYAQHEYTKRDVFERMGMPFEVYGPRPQFWAAFFFIQKRDATRRFFDEWLHYCTQPGILDDTTPGSTPNHPSFACYKHRHDQSVFSLLSWKYKFDIENVTDSHEEIGRPFVRSRPVLYLAQKGRELASDVWRSRGTQAFTTTTPITKQEEGR